MGNEKPSHPAVLIFLILSILATYLFIFGNSLKTAEESNSISAPISGAVQNFVDPESKIPKQNFSFFIRKAAHFSEFALLGFLWVLFLRRISVPKRLYLFIVPSAIVLFSAFTDEFLQSLSDRTDSITDVFLDFTGGLFGICVAFLLSLALSAIHRRKTKKDSPT